MEKREEKKKSDETMRRTDWGILMIAPPVIVWEGLRDHAKLKGKKLWISWTLFWIAFIFLWWLYARFQVQFILWLMFLDLIGTFFIFGVLNIYKILKKSSP